MKLLENKGYSILKKNPYLIGQSKIKYNSIATDFRKRLIDNITSEEKYLKDKLNKNGIKNEFQKIIYHETGFFIVDFYLPKYKIAIEVDGQYHINDSLGYDKDRSLIIRKLGYGKVKRIKNNEVKNFELSNLTKKK